MEAFQYFSFQGRRCTVGQLSVTWQQLKDEGIMDNLDRIEGENITRFRSVTTVDPTDELGQLITELVLNKTPGQSYDGKITFDALDDGKIPFLKLSYNGLSHWVDITAYIRTAEVETPVMNFDAGRTTYVIKDDFCPLLIYRDSEGVYSFVHQINDNEETGQAIGFQVNDYQQFFKSFSYSDVVPDDPNEPGGGGGDYDKGSVSIDIDTFPDDPDDPNFVAGAAGSGLLNIYKPSMSDLDKFAGVLFSSNFADRLIKLFVDPSQFIVSLHMLPVEPSAAVSDFIIFGDRTLDGTTQGIPVVSMPRCYSQFMTYDLGTINVREYWGSALDYAPGTSASIYLPYIGFQNVSIDDIMNASLHLVYNIDILTGACCAILHSTRTQDGTTLEAPLYTWTGSVSAYIPFSMTQGNDALLRLVTASASLVAASTVSGGFGAVIAAGMTSLDAAKQGVGRGGSLQGNAGILANQRPYVVINRPIQAIPSGYESFAGYPSYITSKLGDLTGFTKVQEIELQGVGCTDTEADQIVEQLKAGVVLPSNGALPPSLPATTATIQLGKNGSAKNFVVKSIGSVTAFEGVRSVHADKVETPTIELVSESYLFEYDYAYIPFLGRYYYITGHELTAKGLWTLSLVVDPLMSYASKILQQTAVIERQQSVYNKYLPDSSFVTSAKRRIQTIPFPKFFNRQPTYILAISGHRPTDQGGDEGGENP